GYAFGIYDADRAHGFAHDADGHGPPRVYQVQPTGHPEHTPNPGWFKTRSPLRVIREVPPPRSCPECELENRPQPAPPGHADRPAGQETRASAIARGPARPSPGLARPRRGPARPPGCPDPAPPELRRPGPGGQQGGARPDA